MFLRPESLNSLFIALVHSGTYEECLTITPFPAQIAGIADLRANQNG